MYRGWWLPPNISADGADIDRLLLYLHVFMAVIFVAWGIWFVYCLVRFRERPGHVAEVRPRRFLLPKYLEAGILAGEVALLAFVSAPIWARVKNDFPPPADSIQVRVVAEQYAWHFHYPGQDGKFGPLRQALVDSGNLIGLDRDTRDGKDDVVSGELHIPVGRPVVLRLTSKDVIHSFFIPVMRVKQDVVPGMEIPIHFQAKATGRFEIGCAQLCGLGHYRMRASFIVDTTEDYAAWLAEQEKERGS